MDLELEPDQLELQRIARNLLDRHAQLTVARAFYERRAAPPNELWRTVAALDWFSLGTDPEDGFGLAGACVVAREIGAHAAALPLAEHAAVVARTVASEDRSAALLAQLAAGELVCTLGVIEDRCDWSLHGMSTSARESNQAWLLSGSKRDVPYGASADRIGVIALTTAGLGLFIVDREAQGVSVTPMRALDTTRSLVRVTFDDVLVPADCAFVGRAAEEAILGSLRVASVLTAAEGIGAASAALDLSIAYAHERRQFGQPIGSFQALQHLLADLHVLRETAWSSVLYAASALDDGLADAVEATTIAKAHSARATRVISEGALQVFGGIAFSDEHDVHLLHARVLETEQRFGDSLLHERRLARKLGQRAAVEQPV